VQQPERDYGGVGTKLCEQRRCLDAVLQVRVPLAHTWRDQTHTHEKGIPATSISISEAKGHTKFLNLSKHDLVESRTWQR
jgi:hypothetical protein